MNCCKNRASVGNEGSQYCVTLCLWNMFRSDEGDLIQLLFADTS